MKAQYVCQLALIVCVWEGVGVGVGEGEGASML